MGDSGAASGEWKAGTAPLMPSGYLATSGGIGATTAAAAAAAAGKTADLGAQVAQMPLGEASLPMMSRLGKPGVGSLVSSRGAGVGVGVGVGGGGGGGGIGKRRRWYLGIQSKKEAAHVMTEVWHKLLVVGVADVFLT